MNDPAEEALRYAQEQLQTTAIRALIASHPDPEAFRTQWNQLFATMFQEHTMKNIGNPGRQQHTSAAFQQLLPIWESYLPSDKSS